MGFTYSIPYQQIVESPTADYNFTTQQRIITHCIRMYWSFIFGMLAAENELQSMQSVISPVGEAFRP